MTQLNVFKRFGGQSTLLTCLSAGIKLEVTMEYELKITMWAENKNYDKELADWKGRSQWGPSYAEPQRMLEIKCLHTRVDETQFETIRKAALEVF